MANCPKCGAPLAEGSQFCGNCGSNLAAAYNNANAAPGAAPAGDNFQNTVDGAVKDVSGFFKKLTNTKDYTSECDAADIEKNRVMGILAYIPLLFLIPCFAAPNSKYAKFHANQGVLVTIIFFGLGLVNTLIDLVVWAILGSPDIGFLDFVAGFITGFLGSVSFAFFLFMMIVGLINAVNSKMKELPILGKNRILK